MKDLSLDILTDLVLEEILSGTTLLEMNPYHDAQGRFTSKGATALYGMGAMAAGRAAGMAAHKGGATPDTVRGAIKAGMQVHLKKWEKFQQSRPEHTQPRQRGQAHLTAARAGKHEVPEAPVPPEPKAAKVREPREPRTEPANLQQQLAQLKLKHAEYEKQAEIAKGKIWRQEGDQMRVRAEWHDAQQGMAEVRSQIEAIQGKLQPKKENGNGHARKAKTPAPPPKVEPFNAELARKQVTDMKKAMADEHLVIADRQQELRKLGGGRGTNAGPIYADIAARRARVKELEDKITKLEGKLKGDK